MTFDLDNSSAPELRCPQCSYSLRGTSGTLCPECGQELDYAKLHRSQLPWSYRREIGQFRAYWRTVWLVMFDLERLDQELHSPVSRREAQGFRWLTLGRVYVPLLLATVMFYLFDPVVRFRSVFAGWSYRNIWPIVLFHLCFVLYIVAASGVPSLLLHTRTRATERRRRAAVLSYYCLAPLAFTPVLYIASFLLYWGDMLIAGRALSWRVLHWLALGLPGLLGLWWYLLLLRFAARTVNGSAVSVARLSAALPLYWALLAVLILVILPVMMAYIAIMVVSWI